MSDRLYDKRIDCFFRLENEIIDNNILRGLEYSVYVVLCRYANNNDGAFPSYETISNKAGISKRQAIRIVKILIEKQLLEKVTRKKKGKKNNETNVYYILSAKDLGSDSQSPGSDSQSPPHSDSQSPIKRTNSFINKKGKSDSSYKNKSPNRDPNYANFDQREYTDEDLEKYYINE
jgi:hypothetical protein